jgi:glycosyltransferase involved in cell wall biosynthesis
LGIASPTPASTVVLIPAYNEEEALPRTLAELAAGTTGTAGIPGMVVLVVDDGSTDRTGAVAAAAGARVLRLPYNLGVGAAVRAGLKWAQRRGAQRVVVFDADGQHEPASICALLRALDGGADVAVGSRFGDGAPDYDVGRLRRAAMRSLARTVRRLTGRALTDVTSGLRAFDRRAIEVLAREYPAEYLADTVEVLLVAHHAGLAIVEVPVAMRPRAAGKPSSRGARLAVDFLRLRIGIASAAYRRGRTRRG